MLEIPKISTQGDYSTNIAMTMASGQKMAAPEVARIIMDHIEDSNGLVSKVESAGPGFINFFVSKHKWYEVLRAVHKANNAYGTCEIGRGKRVQVEFVSANPTGPLHVGHGRCAAVGDSLAAILGAAGYEVEKEYYINDSGRQIATLGSSIFLRYREILGQVVEFPADYYQGDYIIDLARELADREGERLLGMSDDQANDLCAKFAAEEILKT